MDVTAIRRARAILKGTTALAAAAGVKVPTASEWLSGRRKVPILRCAPIERAVGGAVTREELRPDVDWSDLGGNPPAAQEAA